MALLFGRFNTFIQQKGAPVHECLQSSQVLLFFFFFFFFLKKGGDPKKKKKKETLKSRDFILHLPHFNSRFSDLCIHDSR